MQGQKRKEIVLSMKLQNGCGKKFNLKAVNRMNVDDIIYFLQIYSNCANASVECEECPLYRKSCLKLESKVLNRSIELLRGLSEGEYVEQENTEFVGD